MPEAIWWEYRDHPNVAKLLPERSGQLFLEMTSAADPIEYVLDFEAIHKKLFRHLTPDGLHSYAGGLRGGCVALFEAEVQLGNGRRGTAPSRVASELQNYRSRVRDRITLLRNLRPLLPADQFTVVLATLIADCFQEFIAIHPFLNGNGHIARAIARGIAFAFGLQAVNFTIEPRPDDAAYRAATQAWDSGNKVPFIALVLKHLVA